MTKNSKLALRKRFLANNIKAGNGKKKNEWVYKSPAPAPKDPSVASAKKQLVPKPRTAAKLNDNKSVATRGTFKTNVTSASKRLESTLSFESEQSSVLFQAHHCWQPMPSSALPLSIVTTDKGAKKYAAGTDDPATVITTSSHGSVSSDTFLESGHCSSSYIPEKNSKSTSKIPLPLPRRENNGGARHNNYTDSLALALTDPRVTKVYNEQTLMATLTKEDTTLASLQNAGGGCCAYEVDMDEDLDYPRLRHLRGDDEDDETLTSDGESIHENLAGKTLSVSKKGALADDLTEISLLSTMGTSTVADSKALDGQQLLSSFSSQSTDLRQMSTLSSAFVKLESHPHMESIAEEEPETLKTDPLFRLLGNNYKRKGNGGSAKSTTCKE